MAPFTNTCYNTHMKATHITAPGPAVEVLELVEVAEPNITEARQIQVQLKAAGVNPK